MDFDKEEKIIKWVNRGLLSLVVGIALFPSVKEGYIKEIAKTDPVASSYLAKRIASYDENPDEISNQEKVLVNAFIDRNFQVNDEPLSVRDLEKYFNKIPGVQLTPGIQGLDAYDRVQNRIEVEKLYYPDIKRR